MPAYLNAVATAVPVHEQHGSFVESLPHWIEGAELAGKVRQIAVQAQIERRYSVLERALGETGSGAFYEYGGFPTTQVRMEVYRREAPVLAGAAVSGLGLGREELSEVTHLIVTTCTGFYAPGIDIDLVKMFGLSPRVKRTVIGFMGCHAAMTGLRQAREAVLADAGARVLVVNVELCTLHLQRTTAVDRLVSYCLFADGAAASLVTGEARGMRLDEAWSALSLADADRMAWVVEDQGFAMTLDPRVPMKIRQAVGRHPEMTGGCASAGPDDVWAVHPGGKVILDAIGEAYGLREEQLAVSRGVLRDFGNMSSATVMFVLERMMAGRSGGGEVRGHALAFGPGLTVEGLDFTMLVP